MTHHKMTVGKKQRDYFAILCVCVDLLKRSDTCTSEHENQSRRHRPIVDTRANKIAKWMEWWSDHLYLH